MPITRSAKELLDDAEAIWRAGLRAVDSRQLVREYLQVKDRCLRIGEDEIDLDSVRRIHVVGAGKAGAGMAAGLEEALGTQWTDKKQLSGWINVPNDCLRSLRRIVLHGARPAGLNEPTEDGVFGTQRILDLVAAATADDICICLLSGGGSALMPAPVDGVTLADKQAVTRHLSGAGANIEELNTVRKQLSRIKGGRLARACRAGRLYTLIISDVLGDPLDVIASGPTVDDTTTPGDALEVLRKFDSGSAEIAPDIVRYLETAATRDDSPTPDCCRVMNLVIGNNATAVDAAGIEAERRGYSHAMMAGRTLEGAAEEVGRHLARMALRMRAEAGPDCLITGGEPTVELIDASQRGKGGRNQQLVLAALQHFVTTQPQAHASDALADMVLLAGGTDGEDGPTDAAGAIATPQIAQRMVDSGLSPDDFLRRNDAYTFFQQLGGLIQTGPTHTNVCDVRVVTVSQHETEQTGANGARD